MAVDQGIIARNAGPSTKPSQPDSKPRGANRSTKVAGKLKVLPDQPDVPTQSKVLNEAPNPPAITPQPVEAKPLTTTDSDEEEADEEEEPEEPEGDADEGRTRGQDREQACGKAEEPHTRRDRERYIDLTERCPEGVGRSDQGG